MKLSNSFLKYGGILSGAVLAGSANASSYLDANVASEVSQVTADATTAQGYGYTILGVVFFGLLVMGILKAFTRKGAGR